jgi:ubiquinone/menaquinone biosynthesis C-methylase UbiE
MTGPSAANTGAYYHGSRALGYEEKRMGQRLWKEESAALRRFMSDAEGSVLDIPVGTGRFLRFYQEIGLSVIGMDVSEDMLKQADAKRTDAELVIGSILEIDLATDSVDTAVCVRLLNLLSEDEMKQALSELQRVARDQIIITLRSGQEITKNKNGRSQTQDHRAFLDVLDGWRILESIHLGKRGYHMHKIVPV